MRTAEAVSLLFIDTNTAIQTALQHGWQEGNKGIQRGHLYCPTHNENQ
jgi:hypothetical protein